MNSIYKDENCTISEGVKLAPKDFRGKMVKVPTERAKVKELYPGTTIIHRGFYFKTKPNIAH